MILKKYKTFLEKNIILKIRFEKDNFFQKNIIFSNHYGVTTGVTPQPLSEI